MARKSEVARNRKHLRIAAEELQYSLPEVSQTLRALAEPYGNRMLTEDREASRVPAGTTNLAIQVPTHLRKAVQDAAVDTAESTNPKVQDLLGQVLAARIPQVLAGELAPREILREPRGSGVEKVTLNVPVDSAVMAELKEQLPEVWKRLGYHGKPAAARLVFRLLLDEYGLDYEPAQSRFAGASMVQMYVPPRLAEAIRAGLEGVGSGDYTEEVVRVLNEAYTKVLDGSWRPYKIPKPARGTEFERERMLAYADSGLLEQIRAKAPELKAELGYRVTPQSIAIDYLINELGLEDLADQEYGTGE